MADKQQSTNWLRTEEYNTLLGYWTRKTKTNNLMNLSGSVTNSTTGSAVKLATTVISTTEDVMIYAVKVYGSTSYPVTFSVDSATKVVLNGSADSIVSTPEAPLFRVAAGSTLAIAIPDITTTANQWNYTVVGKIEPTGAYLEP